MFPFSCTYSPIAAFVCAVAVGCALGYAWEHLDDLAYHGLYWFSVAQIQVRKLLGTTRHKHRHHQHKHEDKDKAGDKTGDKDETEDKTEETDFGPWTATNWNGDHYRSTTDQRVFDTLSTATPAVFTRTWRGTRVQVRRTRCRAAAACGGQVRVCNATPLSGLVVRLGHGQEEVELDAHPVWLAGNELDATWVRWQCFHSGRRAATATDYVHHDFDYVLTVVVATADNKFAVHVADQGQVLCIHEDRVSVADP